MKRAIFVMGCVFIVVSPLPCTTVRGDVEAGRHREEAGKFSFLPPPGWEVRSFPGLKYKVVVGPARSGFASNINVVDEPFEGTLKDYLKANMPALEKTLKNLKIQKQDEFTTTSGLRGMRLTTESEQAGRLLRQTFYFFGPGGTKYVVTCSTLAEGGAALDRPFERAMKTFRIED